MTTLATFRTNISAKIGLDNSTTGDQSLIDGWVNDAYVDVVRRTNCKVQSATASLTSGTKDYTLTTLFSSVMKLIEIYVTSSGSDYKLARTTPDKIVSMRLSSSANVSPAQYYAVAGDLLMIYPTPAAADTVTAYYVKQPTALSVSSDSPSDVPTEYHKLLEWYALAEAGDYDDDQSSAQGERYRQRYEFELVRMKRDLALRGDNRLPRVKTNPRRFPVPNDHSVYPYRV